MLEAQDRSPVEEIAKRTAEAGAGIASAVRAGAMGDHLAMLSDARLRLKEANRIGARLMGVEDIVAGYEGKLSDMKPGDDMQNIMVTGDIVTHTHIHNGPAEEAKAADSTKTAVPAAPIAQAPQQPPAQVTQPTVPTDTPLVRVDTGAKPVAQEPAQITDTPVNAPGSTQTSPKPGLDWKVPAVLAGGMLASAGLGAGIPWLMGAYVPSSNTSTTSITQDGTLYDLRIVKQRKPTLPATP